jgi:predicted amidohydrolase
MSINVADAASVDCNAVLQFLNIDPDTVVDVAAEGTDIIFRLNIKAEIVLSDFINKRPLHRMLEQALRLAYREEYKED